MEVLITAPVYATELEERVRKAVCNLFPDAAVEVRKDQGVRQGSELREAELRGYANDLETFTIKLRDQKIRDTARSILMDSVVGNDIAFHLNKQAAFTGKVNFSDGDSLLGDIKVIIRCDDAEALIDGLTSKEVID